MRFATWNPILGRYELYELQHDKAVIYFKYNEFNPMQMIWFTEGELTVEDTYTGEFHKERGEVFAQVNFAVKLKGGPLNGMVRLHWIDNLIRGKGRNEVVTFARWDGGRYVIRGGMAEYHLEHVDRKGRVEQISGMDTFDNLLCKAAKDASVKAKNTPDTCK